MKVMLIPSSTVARLLSYSETTARCSSPTLVGTPYETLRGPSYPCDGWPSAT